MITVACVLKSGGVYTADWVRKLRAGVARHLSTAHRFACLTDMEQEVDAAGVEAISLPELWPGWWSKICLWHPSVGLTGRVLYFDLDSIVVGSLDRIASFPHRFTMAHDFSVGHACSTAMAWNGDFSFITEAFRADPKGIARRYDRMLASEKRIGDQAFIEDQLLSHGEEILLFDQVAGERSIASYKVDRCQGAPCIGAAVVAFHGKPKPHEIKTGWVPEIWR
ncbi:hypothetical protein [Shinella pollutisoli]|uniref:Glycosyltransferase n=1 Tax=Shinella pollutisoli TaxID=2250594 RepID=A0ABV7DC48_9HYPH|nr:hypothetical protein [Shinella pollutisoli]